MKEDLFKWSPIPLNITFEEGRGIKQDNVSEDWKWYFNRSEFDWHLFIKSMENRKEGTQYLIDSIVENTYHKPIARVIQYGSFEMFHGRKTAQKWLPGRVVSIPVLDGWTYEDIIRDTLYYVFEGATEPSPEDTPEWTNEYTVPGEQEVSDTVDDLQEQIEQLNSQLTEKEDKLDEIREIKGLLYSGDDFLERLVPRVFREIGFDVEGEISGGRDGLIDLENTTVILETHGTTGGISKNKCRQLNNHVEDYQYEHPSEDLIGILVVNPFRQENPSDRDKSYNSDVVDYVERCGNKILLTTELFNIYVQYLNNETSQAEIVSQLTGDDIVINHSIANK